MRSRAEVKKEQREDRPVVLTDVMYQSISALLKLLENNAVLLGIHNCFNVFFGIDPKRWRLQSWRLAHL